MLWPNVGCCGHETVTERRSATWHLAPGTRSQPYGPKPIGRGIARRRLERLALPARSALLLPGSPAVGGRAEADVHLLSDGVARLAGVEQAIGRNTYAKVEYRYSNYGSARLEYPNGANTNNFSVDTDRHQVAVGVGLRF